jgi:hypothetical protein
MLTEGGHGEANGVFQTRLEICVVGAYFVDRTAALLALFPLFLHVKIDYSSVLLIRGGSRGLTAGHSRA